MLHQHPQDELRAAQIPFITKTVKDSTLPKGISKIRTIGVTGVKTLTYQVTLTDGTQTSKTLLRQRITTQPVTIGTKQTQQCDPNYSGARVPIASDVDCAGGGNGRLTSKGRCASSARTSTIWTATATALAAIDETVPTAVR